MPAFRQLVGATRSVRRFKQDPVAGQTLEQLVDLARLTASGANKQPLKYILSHTPEKNAKIFPHTRWAGALKEWDGPAEGERPTAYIVILLDTTISKGAGCDHGIAAQTVALGARDAGLGACMVGSLDRARLAEALELEERYEILLVVALGVQAEAITLEEIAPEDSTAYYRDAQDVHHVPKRRLEDLIVG